MTENELREKVATWLNSYKGIAEGSSAHKELINIFNNSGLCTRYKMTTSDAWCAMAVSDAFIATDLTSIFPCVECACSSQVTLAKNAGIWVEDDSYTPKVGDVIMYDWNDSGSGDNTGTPDHVGIVQSISGKSFTVIEGNKSDTVGVRSMTVNGRYIRGYITPDYASAASSSSKTTTTTTTTDTSSSTTKTDTSSSKTTTTTTTTTSTTTSIDYADYFDASLAGTYTVTASSLNLRAGAKTSKTILIEMPNSSKVKCYGYYSKTSGENWLLVEYTTNGTTYTGFACATYLSGSTTSSSSTSSKSSTSSSSSSTSSTAPLYYIQVTIDNLNVRAGAGTNYAVVGTTGKGCFGITQEKTGQVDNGTGQWGKLLSGFGWVWLNASHVTKL